MELKLKQRKTFCEQHEITDDLAKGMSDLQLVSYVKMGIVNVKCAFSIVQEQECSVIMDKVNSDIYIEVVKDQQNHIYKRDSYHIYNRATTYEHAAEMGATLDQLREKLLAQ